MSIYKFCKQSVQKFKNVCVCMFVCNVLFCFVLLPIVKIVLMQICFRKPENVYYEYCSSANKNIKKKKKKIYSEIEISLFK